MQPTFVLSDTEAGLAAQAARAEIARLGKPVSIALTDAGGHLVFFERHGAAAPITAQIAVDKARCAALSGRPTAAWEDQIAARPVLMALPGVFPVAGGLPVMAGGRCIGGIGVAGAASDEDARIAGAALAAILGPAAGERRAP